MPTKPMVKTLWLIIAAAFLIGLGLAGLGFALGGNAPVGLGPGGMRFVDFRTGTVYNSRMEAPVVNAEPLSGVVTEDINTIRVYSVSADIRVVPVDAATISYEVRPEGSLNYSVTTSGGMLAINPVQEATFFGLGNVNFGWWGGNLEGEIIIEVPREMNFATIEISSVSGSINADVLSANTVQLRTVSGSINAGTVGDSSRFASRLEIHSVSGSANVRAGYVHSLELTQVSGSSNIALAELQNFTVESSSISASITVGGTSLGNGTSTFGSGSKRADISTISGSVTLTEVPLQVPDVVDIDDSEIEEEYETP